MYLTTWTLFVACQSLLPLTEARIGQVREHERLMASTRMAFDTRPTNAPTAASSSFLKKLTSSVPPAQTQKVPSLLIKFYLLVIAGGFLLMTFIAYVFVESAKAHKSKQKQKAEDALQKVLQQECARELRKKDQQIEIFNEQQIPRLQQAFAEAQAENPLDTSVVRNADVQDMKPKAAFLRQSGGAPAKISWSTLTTTDDFMAWRILHQGKKAVGLSYADGCRPGGSFFEGRGSVEESFCCGSFYYRSLEDVHGRLHTALPGEEQNHFGFPDVRSKNGQIEIRKTNRAREGSGEDEWHVWKPEEEFQDYATVLVSQNVRRYRTLDQDTWRLLQPADQHFITIVSAAAPRWAEHTGKSTGKLGSASEEESDLLFKGTDSMAGKQPLREAIETIVLAPKRENPDLQVLVVGPWGTGPLRGNFEKSVHYMLQVLIETNAIYLYEEVHFNFYANRRVETLQNLLERGLELPDAPALVVERLNEPLTLFRDFVPAPDAAEAA